MDAINFNMGMYLGASQGDQICAKFRPSDDFFLCAFLKKLCQYPKFGLLFSNVKSYL
jgi:hypothetical protein